MHNIAIIRQSQHGDLFVLWIDNPVLGDAGSCVIAALLDQIAAPIFAATADDLHHQVSALPEEFADPVGMFLQHEYDVGLAVLSGLNADANTHEEYFANVTLQGKRLQHAE